MSALRKIVGVGVASGWCIMCIGGAYIAGLSLGTEIAGLGIAMIGGAIILGIGWSDF